MKRTVMPTWRKKKIATSIVVILTVLLIAAALIVMLVVGRPYHSHWRIVKSEHIGVIVGAFLCVVAAVFLFTSIAMVVNLLVIRSWIRNKMAELETYSVEEFVNKYPNADIDALFKRQDKDKKEMACKKIVYEVKAVEYGLRTKRSDRDLVDANLTQTNENDAQLAAPLPPSSGREMGESIVDMAKREALEQEAKPTKRKMPPPPPSAPRPIRSMPTPYQEPVENQEVTVDNYNDLISQPIIDSDQAPTDYNADSETHNL